MVQAVTSQAVPVPAVAVAAVTAVPVTPMNALGVPAPPGRILSADGRSYIFPNHLNPTLCQYCCDCSICCAACWCPCCVYGAIKTALDTDHLSGTPAADPVTNIAAALLSFVPRISWRVMLPASCVAMNISVASLCHISAPASRTEPVANSAASTIYPKIAATTACSITVATRALFARTTRSLRCVCPSHRRRSLPSYRTGSQSGPREVSQGLSNKKPKMLRPKNLSYRFSDLTLTLTLTLIPQP